MRKQLLLLPLLLLTDPLTFAKLRFEQTAVLVRAALDDKILAARYPFTNDSAASVEIVSIATSCGCTAAAVEKKHLVSGEAGVVNVTYHVPVGEGSQSQTVTIRTDEPSDNTYTLTFKAELPAATQTVAPANATISPRMLFWSRRPFEAKHIKVDYSAMADTKLTASTSTPGFEIKRLAATTAHEAVFEILPLPSTTNAQAELIVTVETAAGIKQEHKVPLHVRPAKP
jgi:hypothetical protein